MITREEKERELQHLIVSRQSMPLENQIFASKGIIADIEKIDEDKAFLKIKKRISGIELKISFIEQFKRVAAVLFIPLLLASFLLLFIKHPSYNPEVSVQELFTPPGVRSQITLPDGTNVWLNAESKIKYSIPFNKQIREVSLEGEAFFDVFRNPAIPFIVKSAKAEVRVLGTQFNYKAYKGEQTEIVLAKGQIRLEADKISNEKYIMSPGERAVINEKGEMVSLTDEKIDKYIAWHSGRLVFDNAPLQEVAKKIGRWYGINVYLKDTRLSSYRITTTFENESLNDVLELLELSSPLTVDYIPAVINKKTGKQVKSRITISIKNN